MNAQSGGDGGAANTGGVQVIARVGQIFRALDGEPWGLTLSQLAVRLKLPRSTVHRLVSALVNEGLLMSASVAGRVRIGTEFVRIATASRSELRDQVAPLMRRVNEAVGETIDCGVLEGDQVRVIDVIETHHQLRAVSNIGAVFPLYCTAKGKAILAELDDAVAAGAVGQCGKARALEEWNDDRRGDDQRGEPNGRTHRVRLSRKRVT